MFTLRCIFAVGLLIPYEYVRIIVQEDLVNSGRCVATEILSKRVRYTYKFNKSVLTEKGYKSNLSPHACTTATTPPQVRLRQKLSLNAVKSFFTGKEEKDPAVAKLEELKVLLLCFYCATPC